MLIVVQVFIGLALLLAAPEENRLECVFVMMDRNDSGRVSVKEMEMFLRTIAPLSVSPEELSALAIEVIHSPCV